MKGNTSGTIKKEKKSCTNQPQQEVHSGVEGRKLKSRAPMGTATDINKKNKYQVLRIW